jgi:hypothetical protein
MTQLARTTGDLDRRRPVPDLSLQWEEVVVPGSDPAPWMSDALRAVNAFEELGPGWDGGDGPVPSTEVLQLARRIVVETAQVQIGQAPHIGPVPGGGVQIEWHLGGRDLELEILPDLSLGLLAIDGERVFAQEVSIVERVPKARALVEWLTR